MTFLINSNVPSSAWLASTADFSQRNKRAAENVANEEKATDNLINSDSIIPQDGEMSSTSLAHNAVTKYKHASVALINQLHHKLPTVIALSPDDFYHDVNDEQVRLLCGLLTEEGYITSQPCDIILVRELVNHVTDYLTRFKDDEEKIAKLVRLLLKPLGEYGANPGEKISSARQQAVIANWLQYAVLGMSCEAWILEQVSDIKSQGDSLFHHSSLQGRLFNQLNSQSESGKLSPETCAYFQQHVVNRIMPTFMPQVEKHKDGEKLSGVMINQPEWGYLHAGLTLLQESGADIKGMSLEEINNNGMLLAALLQEKILPAEYNRYFKIPALIHERLNSEQTTTPTLEMTDVYANYFDYLIQSEQNNPFIKLINLSQNWKSRPELASQKLTAHNIPSSWLNVYLDQNREVTIENEQGETFLLPNIDEVFAEQNQQIAKFTEQTDRIMLPLAFNSIKQDEQVFIERADIKLVKAEFNAIGSYRSIPMRGARRGMAAGGLITRVPESIDLLQCKFNGEQRMYALTLEQDGGRYRLYRVDEDKQSILGLFGHDGRAYNDDYKLKTHPIMPLKTANDKADILFEKLAKRHGEKLAAQLQEEGYQETTRQKVEAFFLSLIPFYTMITEAQKGNKGKAVLAGSLDLLSFLPFIGKGAQVGSRFSIAMGEAAIKGLRTGLAQATIRQALREGGKQFVKFGIPHIANRLPAKTYINLGITFLRSADPGFELLTSGGIRGVNALKNAARQLQHEIKGLNPLIKALEKKTQDLAAESVKSFKMETAYHPELGKEVQIVNIGQQQGKDIWVQVNLENNTLFGRKYRLNSTGELELAPVSIRERLYQLKTQGMGGKGANKAAQRWTAETKRVTGSATNAERLYKLKELIGNREANTVINLTNADLSNINFSNYFNMFNVKIDLSSADLTGINLRNSKLYQIKLKKAKLDVANLSQSSLMHSNLTKASMMSANLRDAKLNEAILRKVDLGSADLTKAILDGVDLTEAKLMNSKLADARMIFTKLNNADLYSANLNNALLIYADLTQANLTGANLTAADMTAAILTKNNLTGSELRNANLTKAKLKKANLTNANMSGASMLEADLTEATLINTNLSGADLSDATLKELWILGANFTGAKLNNTSFTLALPKWTENNLNTALNHFDNKISLLTTIDSIDNQYSELKNKLALQLIRSLDKPSLNLTNVTFPLLDILSKEPFIINQDISLFVNKLVANLENHASQFFSAAETAFHPVFKTNIKITKIGQQQGNDIWMQIDPKRGALFGEKYYRDTENNLQLAPVEVQKQFLVAQPLSESQGKKVFIEQKALSSTISTTGSAFYANKPSPLEQSLSRDDLDWILTSILRPAKELNAKGPCGLTSAGIFTYLNGGGRELANTFFHEVINNAKHGRESGMLASDLINRLVNNGTEVNVDIYLKSIPDKPRVTHGYLAAELGDIAREHLFDINAIRAKIDSMPPGESQMFFIDNSHVITLARDNDNKLWLFDTALNPKMSNFPGFEDFTEFQDVTKSGENYATDLEAQAILDKYLQRIQTQPVIVSIKHK